MNLHYYNTERLELRTEKTWGVQPNFKTTDILWTLQEVQVLQ
jgi:hypothetical protein